MMVRSVDPLFGGGIRLDDWAHRGDARAGLGFWPMLLRLPGLMRTTFGLAWEAGRWALPVAVLANILAGAGTAVLLLATNRALAELLAGPPTWQRLAASLPAMALAVIGGVSHSVLSSLGRAASGRLEPRIDRVAYIRLLERAVRVELAVMQDAGFHNLLTAAQRGALAARRVTRGVVALVEALAGLIAAAGVLAVLHPVLLPLLVGVIVPQAWGTVRAARARFVSFKTWTELNRQLDMLAELLVTPAAAEEVRVHRTSAFLLGHYRRLSELVEREHARLATGEAYTSLLADGASGVAQLATYGMLGVLLGSGAIPLAVAGTVVLAVRTGTQNLTSLVTAVNELYEHGLFVQDWQRACQQADAEAMHTGPVRVDGAPREIEVRDLSFSYPNSPRRALRGVNMVARRGEVVALVGENGSGKSTLAKLLAGLYLPADGTVRWDGRATTELDRTSMFEQVALASQSFVRWPFTARVNVTIGRPERAERPEVLWDAARFSSADQVVSRLGGGWDTLLAREFWGGTELSGGEWQRIGLARARYRDAPVVILDEPTAALDPPTEVATFERLDTLAARGRIVVVVTHRVASVRRADRIYVLSGGRVAEHGTHQSLLAENGQYAMLYRLQAGQPATVLDADEH